MVGKQLSTCGLQDDLHLSSSEEDSEEELKQIANEIEKNLQ
jgi:hypothetical protein